MWICHSFWPSTSRQVRGHPWSVASEKCWPQVSSDSVAMGVGYYKQQQWSCNQPQNCFFFFSKNGGYPNSWLVCKGKSYWNGWFGGTPILGTPHVDYPFPGARSSPRWLLRVFQGSVGERCGSQCHHFFREPHMRIMSFSSQIGYICICCILYQTVPVASFQCRNW